MARSDNPFRYFNSSSEMIRLGVQGMRAFSRWKWHLDEIYVKINGEMHYLWRGVDHEGEVLESFATKERDKDAALKFMKRLMKRDGSAKALVTDGLRIHLLQKSTPMSGKAPSCLSRLGHLATRARAIAIARVRAPAIPSPQV